MEVGESYIVAEDGTFLVQSAKPVRVFDVVLKLSLFAVKQHLRRRGIVCLIILKAILTTIPASNFSDESADCVVVRSIVASRSVLLLLLLVC